MGGCHRPTTCVLYGSHIRPFATARRAWLFADTPKGAKAGVVLYTLVESAKTNDLDVYGYLKYLLTEMPDNRHLEHPEVRMIDINYRKNQKMMEACRPLAEYAWLIWRIREDEERLADIEAAVDAALDAIPGDFLIRPFLVGNRAEVKDMCITEYNEAQTMQMLREEGREEGRKEGRAEGEGRVNQLILKLTAEKRYGDLERAAMDRAFQEELYVQYGL